MKFWFKQGVKVSKRAEQAIKAMSPDQITKVAVIRHAALGDMVITRCFLVELRKAFKNATITLSISSNYTRGVPEDLIDILHVVHGSDQKDASFPARIKRIKELGHQNIIFDLAATNRSFLTCLFASADLKIGYPYRPLQAKIFYDVAVTRSDLNYEVDDMLSMLNVMGIKTEHPYQFNMPGEALRREKPYLVYFTGSAGPDRCWPVPDYAKLIALMAKKYPEYDHLILEGLHEWEKAEAVLKDMEPCKNVSPITAEELDETVSLLKGATMVVANDTGIRHLAIVSDTATVGIFFASYPFRYWPRTGQHDVVIPVEGGLPSVDDVFTSCCSLLGRITP